LTGDEPGQAKPQNRQSNLELGHHEYESIILRTEPEATSKISTRTWTVMIALAFVRFDKMLTVNKEHNA